MSSWVTVPCLLTLRDEFNRVSPHRDKGADGTIGDSAHTSSSDHTPDEDSDALRGRDSDHVNEVHALDIDSSGPWPGGGAWFDRKIKQLVAEERRRWLDPDDMCRLDYIIHDRVIYSRSRNFAPKAYAGSDPHTNHAHFSARYETRAENDTRPWGVYEQKQQEDDMSSAQEIAKAVWEYPLRNPYSNVDQFAGTLLRFAPSASWHQTTQAKVDALAEAFRVFVATESADDAAKQQALRELEAAVGDVEEQVIAGLTQEGRSDAEVAADLRAALGDRADGVFRAGLAAAPSE